VGSGVVVEYELSEPEWLKHNRRWRAELRWRIEGKGRWQKAELRAGNREELRASARALADGFCEKVTSEQVTLL